jgi:hypothetical protein
MKKRPVVERLKYELLVDALDYFAGLLAGGVEAEVHQDDETVERNEQSSVFIWPTPVAGARLASEKLRSPAFGFNARALDSNSGGRFLSEVPHDLPSNRGIRIEEPFKLRGSGSEVVWAHSSLISTAGSRKVT